MSDGKIDINCQNYPIPLHCQTNKYNKGMVEIILSAGMVAAKCAAVALMVIACGAIYIIEAQRTEESM